MKGQVHKGAINIKALHQIIRSQFSRISCSAAFNGSILSAVCRRATDRPQALMTLKGSLT